MKTSRTWLATVLMGLFAVGVIAGPKGDTQLYHTSDASPALRINNTSKYKCVITITGDDATNTVVIGSTTTTIDMSGTDVDTIAELASAIAAATDDDGNTPLVVDSYSGAVLTSESVDAELMVEAVTIERAQWGSINWDTSDTKHYRAAVAKKTYGASRGSVLVKSVYGSAGGTGDVTVTAYINRVEVYRKVIESPVYAWSAAGTTETWAEDDVSMGVIDIPLNLVVSPSDNLTVSVDRETTGTTGGIGIRTQEL